MNLTLEAYLDNIQEREVILQEFEPITTGAVIAGGAVIADLITVLLTVSLMRKAIDVDKTWSDRLNSILGTNDWKVYKIKDKMPNGFSIGGKHVFITEGLIKMMSRREVEAIMLHEVYHSQAKHMPKKMAYQYPFYYLIVFIAASTAMISYPLFGLLIFLILKSVPNIAYALLAGKRHERQADENTIKYGYGNDLISALNKLEAKIKRMAAGKPCGYMCKLINKINEAIDEHPPIKKRVENILKKSKELDKLAKSKNIKGIKKFVMGVFKT